VSHEALRFQFKHSECCASRRTKAEVILPGSFAENGGIGRKRLQRSDLLSDIDFAVCCVGRPMFQQVFESTLRLTGEAFSLLHANEVDVAIWNLAPAACVSGAEDGRRFFVASGCMIDFAFRTINKYLD
jgi:predicted nucleotidyltransferase